MVQSTGRAQCLVFSQVLDAQVWEVGRDGVDEGLEDRFLVVADDEDFLDLSNGRNRAEAMFDNGVTCDREERLL